VTRQKIVGVTLDFRQDLTRLPPKKVNAIALTWRLAPGAWNLIESRVLVAPETIGAAGKIPGGNGFVRQSSHAPVKGVAVFAAKQFGGWRFNPYGVFECL
jgi:hypothetical protein